MRGKINLFRSFSKIFERTQKAVIDETWVCHCDPETNTTVSSSKSSHEDWKQWKAKPCCYNFLCQMNYPVQMCFFKTSINIHSTSDFGMFTLVRTLKKTRFLDFPWKQHTALLMKQFLSSVFFWFGSVFPVLKVSLTENRLELLEDIHSSVHGNSDFIFVWMISSTAGTWKCLFKVRRWLQSVKVVLLQNLSNYVTVRLNIWMTYYLH
jgi:hypothetical protein